MRAAIFLSIAGHIVFVALALFGAPRLLDNSANSPIEIELVPSEEAPQPKEEPKPEPKPEKPTAWDLPADKPEPWPEASAPPPQPSQQPQPKEPEPAPQPSSAPPSEQAGPQPEPRQEAKSEPSIFDPANIPTLLNLPNAPDKGFDSEATTAANLSPAERAAFKAHLKKCWKLPAGMSQTQTTRVVLRVTLRRDGKLASDPVLIEASASRDGPAVMQAAMRAIKDCQPFGFLPPEKYTEWRMLDLSFSPREMAGG